MKKLILIFLFCLPLSAISQYKTNIEEVAVCDLDVTYFDSVSFLSENTRNYYLQKGEKQSRTARFLLGIGTGMVIVGLVGFKHNFELFSDDSSQDRRSDFFGGLFVAGAILDLVSIPLFISASQNKKKAMVLSVSYQEVNIPIVNSMTHSNPALSLKISF